MKTIKALLVSAAAATLTTSCLNNDDPYSAGFVFQYPHYANNVLYANNTTESIVMGSYGNWQLAGATTWCKPSVNSGRADSIYHITVTFTENTTGSERVAYLRFTDTQHPDEGRTTLLYNQFSTRGDGSLGSAPQVKAISGSDGSLFEFAYDLHHRPTSLRISKNGTALRSLKLTFNDADSTMTVQDGEGELKGKYDKSYQADRLTGRTDTVGYYSQYTIYGTLAHEQAFNVEHHHVGRQNTYYAIRLGGQSLHADSLHCADSLRVGRQLNNGTEVLGYKMYYSAADNRCQTTDANQLVFGAEQCDPYQLLSLFRHARNTSIVSRMESNTDSYDVEATLNADKSVNQLTVTYRTAAFSLDDPDANVKTVTYTFEY